MDGRVLAPAVGRIVSGGEGPPMGWKEILVRVSGEAEWRPLAGAAAALAARLGAHLVGIDVLHLPDRSSDAAVRRGLGEDYLDQRRRDLEEEATALGEEFRREVEKPGLQVEWRVADGDLVEVLVAQSRTADLLVLGPAGPPAVSLEELHLAAPVVLASGRPVLVFPAGRTAPPGRHVAIGWNASREAARAVADALPLVEGAERVSILVVRPGQERGGQSGEEVAHYLAAHGRKAEVVTVDAGHAGAGEVLLERVAALGADLLVMGAYGHSRLRELVVGGATRTVLERARVPVLLSH